MAQLTIERQFEIAKFNQIVEEATRDQLLTLAKDLFVQYLMQDAHYKELIKHQWNLDPR